MRFTKYFSFLLLTASFALPAIADHRSAPPIAVQVVDAYGHAFKKYPARRQGADNETRAYVEALPGESYALRVTNRSAERVGLVIAVDGRNIISGKKSKLKARERMYVLGPYESATYRGWRTDRDRVNEFYFTRDTDSYAGAFGDYSAMGVVAVAAFRDRNHSEPVYRRHEQEQSYDGHRRGKSSPPSTESRANRADKAAPGTGFGDERYAPSYRVHFEAERRPFAKSFIKYEWRETLCEMGVTRCHARNNRFWGYDHAPRKRGYAPYPPGYRHLSYERRVKPRRYR